MAAFQASIGNMVGDSGSGGQAGLVPAPGSGDAAAGKFLNAGGTYSIPPGTGGFTAFAPNVRVFTSGSGTYGLSYYFIVTSANATVGATYTNSTFTFTVVSTIASGTSLLCTSTGAPAASGTLTKASGTGDSTITFTSVRTPVCTVVEIQGGGGGGGANGGSGSTSGGNTTFATLTANGGAGGATTTGSFAAGGTASGGDINVTGGDGGAAVNAATIGIGGPGGSSYYGGGGQFCVDNGGNNINGRAGTAYGSGGGGNLTVASGGGGGSAGGYCRKTFVSPAATVTYAVGASGAGGTGGGGATTGGAGVAGIIWAMDCFE